MLRKIIITIGLCIFLVACLKTESEFGEMKEIINTENEKATLGENEKGVAYEVKEEGTIISFNKCENVTQKYGEWEVVDTVWSEKNKTWINISEYKTKERIVRKCYKSERYRLLDKIFDLEYFGKCSIDDNCIICDEKRDGDGNGECSPGETCIKYCIQDNKIVYSERNSRKEFTDNDETITKEDKKRIELTVRKSE